MSVQLDRHGVPRVDHEPGEPPHPAPPPGGPLILIGGATTTHGDALRSFVSMCRQVEGRGRVVGLTSASGDPVESARYWMGVFHTLGVRHVEFPAFDRTKPDVDASVAALVRDACAVFLGGGDQVKLVSALSGTTTEVAIRDLHERGGVVCGTSAGAAALTELTMAGGEVDEEGNLVEQYIGPGFGLLGHQAIVDTHFSQRRRLQRLFLVVASNTELLGLGIDEDTALIVRDDVGEVVGAGGVMFVDGRDTVRYGNANDLDKGRQLTLSHLRVGIVGTRYHLDLRERDLYELLHPELGNASYLTPAGIAALREGEI